MAHLPADYVRHLLMGLSNPYARLCGSSISSVNIGQTLPIAGPINFTGKAGSHARARAAGRASFARLPLYIPISTRPGAAETATMFVGNDLNLFGIQSPWIDELKFAITLARSFVQYAIVNRESRE